MIQFVDIRTDTGLFNVSFRILQAESRNVDPILFNEFMKWHLNPTLWDESDYMKRVLTEDVSPCLRFHPATTKISNAILKTIVDNALVIEAIPHGSEAASVCRLSKVCCDI